MNKHEKARQDSIEHAQRKLEHEWYTPTPLPAPHTDNCTWNAGDGVCTKLAGHTGVHQTTPTIRTEDYTLDELFPDPNGFWAPFCRECGCEIRSAEPRAIHVTWHNKLLP